MADQEDATPSPNTAITDLDTFQRLIECAICCDYLQVVRETPCCHSLYCRRCLDSWAASHSTCPGCRAKLDLPLCVNNVPIQRFVDSLPFECPFKLQGCPAKPQRSDLEKHKQLCTFRPDKLAAELKLRKEKLAAEKDAATKRLATILALSLDERLRLASDLLSLSKQLNEVSEQAESLKLAESAENICRANAPDSADLVNCLLHIGLLHLNTAKYEQALRVCEEGIGLATKKDLSELHVHILLLLGDIQLKQGIFNDSSARYVQALDLAKSTNSPFVSEILNKIGLVAKKLNDYEKASNAYHEALKTLRPEDPVWAEVVSNLADVLRKKGKYNEAKDLYLQSLKRLESVHGSLHPQVGEVNNQLGMLAKKEGKYGEALAYYRTALKTAKHFFGNDHPQIGMILNNVADIHRKQGNYVQAEGIYMEALATLEKTLGKEHIEVAEVLNSMGLVLKKRGQYEGAEALYQRAVKIVVKTFGENHYKFGIYTNNLADTYRKRHQLDKALDLYKKALTAIEGTLGKEHSEAAEVLHNMGLVFVEQSKFEQGIEFYERALKIVLKEFGEVHYKVGMFLNSKGLAHAMMEDFKLAYDDLKKALQILIQTLNKDHVEVADVYTNLGDVVMKLLADQRNAARMDELLSEGEKYYTEAKRIVEASLGPAHAKVKQLDSLLFIISNYRELT